MFVEVNAQGDTNFQCNLVVDSANGVIVQIRKFPYREIPSFYPNPWIPSIESHSLVEKGRGTRRMRKEFPYPISTINSFDFLRCLIEQPAFTQNVLKRVSEKHPVSTIRFELRTENYFSTHLAWYQRILKLINEFIHCFEVFSWLSTLGGAYSAMGDYGQEYAEVAKKISMKQMKLAIQMGDSTQVCRCWIFLALSAMQHGRLKTSRRILTNQWKFATSSEGLRDPRLKNMIIGSWERLKVERTLRRQENK